MPSYTAPDLTSLDRLGPWVCCVCDRLPAPHLFSREPVDVHPVEDRPPGTCYSMSVSGCPHCRAKLYFAELVVVPDPPHKHEFIDDNCWNATYREFYQAHANGLSWKVEHNREVSDIAFIEPPPSHGTKIVTRPWLDKHYLPLIAAKNIEEASDQVRAFAERAYPSISALSW